MRVEPRRFNLLLVAGVFLLVRLIFISGIPAHRIDDVPHAILASAIAERINPTISAWHEATNDAFAQGLALWRNSFFAQRTLFQVPIAVSILLFGYTKPALLLPSFVYSVLCAVLVYWTCCRVWNQRTACVALFLLAVAPLDVFAATSLQVDSAVGFYHVLSFALLTWGTPHISGPKGAIAFALAGLGVGLSYLCKQPGIFMLPTLVVYAFLFGGSRWFRLSVIGTMSCLAPIALRTGYAMLVEGSGILEEYELLYRSSFSPFYEGPPLRQLLGFDLLKRFSYPFSDEQFGNGALGLALLVALVWSVKRWRHLNGHVRCLVFWIVSVLVLFNFAPIPINIFPYRPALWIQTRYFLPIVFPGVMFLAWHLARARPRVMVPLLSLLALVNTLTIAANWALFSDREEHPAVLAMEKISSEFPREVPVYSSIRTAGYLNLLPPKRERRVIEIPGLSSAMVPRPGGLVLVNELHLRQDFTDKGRTIPDVLVPDESKIVFRVPSTVVKTYSFKLLSAITSGLGTVLGPVERFRRFQERLRLRERSLRVQVVG